MGIAQTEVDEREIKGGNQTSTKSGIITIHAPSKKKENAETYQMTQRNKYFTTGVSHMHRLKAKEWLKRAIFFFLMYQKITSSPGPNNCY
jgi:hypothetical protein